MEPVYFDGHNVVYGKGQPQYRVLPVYRNGDTITSCWSLTWKERIHMLMKGQFFITVMNFNEPLQPILPRVDWHA